MSSQVSVLSLASSMQGKAQKAAQYRVCVMQVGGQRLAQCLVYLNTLSTKHGGGTKFHHPLFRGLTVSPVQGDALMFFTAWQDGQEDARMVHSGEKVLGDGEKWIINTWACQYPRTTECLDQKLSKNESNGFCGKTSCV